MPIQEIRQNVASVEHAFAELEAIDARYEKRVTRWQHGAWLALVVGLAIPGPIGQTALCLSALAAMRWLRLVANGAGRYWFMHQLALHDLLSAPAAIDWNFLCALLDRVPKPEVVGNEAASNDSQPEQVH